jgi:hypothetical protein
MSDDSCLRGEIKAQITRFAGRLPAVSHGGDREGLAV